MTAKKIEHNGKTQSLIAWSRETGLKESTLRERLKLGWPIDKALTTPPDTGANHPSLGRNLHTGILASLKKVWDESGKDAFETQLAASFQKDAIKTVLAFQNLLPRIVSDDRQEKPLAAIQINNVVKPDELKYFKPLEG